MSIVCCAIRKVEYRGSEVPFPDPNGVGLPLRASLYPQDMFTSVSFSLRATHRFKCRPPIDVRFYEEIRRETDWGLLVFRV